MADYKHRETSMSRHTELLHVILVNFHPLHFVASMGIGVTSGVMYNFPIDSVKRGMKYVGVIYFFINLVVIVINHSLFTLKYLIFPYVYPHDKRYSVKLLDLMHKPQLSVFLGASQMSFVTMVNMLHYLEPRWKIANFVLWWIVFAQSLCCIVFVTFFNFSNFTNPIREGNKKRIQDLEKSECISINSIPPSVSMEARFNSISPVLMLPLVTCTVTAAGGGLVLDTLEHGGLIIAFTVVLVMLLAIALIGSFLCLGVIFVRLYVMGLPKNNFAFTMFVPIGLMGQASWACILIARGFSKAIVKNGFEIIGLENTNDAPVLFENIIMIFALSISISLVAFGILLTLWCILSVLYWYIGFPRIGEKFSLTVADKKNHRLRLIFWSPTMWAATFPLATIALSGHEIYNVTGLIGFKVLSAIYGFSVIGITTWCMVGTALYIVPWRKMSGVYSV